MTSLAAWCVLSLVLSVCIFGYPASIGIQAWRRSTTAQGEYAATLRMIALHLVEPAINSFLVSIWFLLLTTPHLDSRNCTIYDTPPEKVAAICEEMARRYDYDNRYDYGHQFLMLANGNLLAALLITAPMLVLLLPLKGRHFGDPDCRQLCLQLAVVGVDRWLAHTMIYSGIPLLVMLGGLAGVILYGTNTYTLISLVRRRAYPICPQPTLVAPPASIRPTIAPTPVALQMVPAPTLTLRCPICHAPTDLHDQDCSDCGLRFASRVPLVLHHLPGYTVLRPLSPGGMGSVYLARAQHTAQLCVIKTLAGVDGAGDSAWHADAATCLSREAAILAQVDHPHIPRLLEAHCQGDLRYLALEYIPGPTIAQRLSHLSPQGEWIIGAPIPPAEALPLAARLAATLADLTDLPRRLMHLDLKPGNVIIPRDRPAPVLVDFGSAAWATDTGACATRSLITYGTPGYAAPEQYRGQVSPQSDCYGLAATLYHMLTDDDPSAHPLTFPALPTLPADIAALLTRALDRDPERRPPMRALHTSLEALVAHDASTASR